MTTKEAITTLEVMRSFFVEDGTPRIQLEPSETPLLDISITALKAVEKLEKYIKVVEAAKADFVNIAILKAILGEEK